MTSDKRITFVTMIAAKLNSPGIKHMFGILGGGSSLDLIAECAQQDIVCHLARHEEGAAYSSHDPTLPQTCCEQLRHFAAGNSAHTGR